ncbi:MAG: succinate dehydrogenase cytochrome b subunit [Bacteroidetes bacterium]|nr:succinate dehydrogenase cytochrome b subunit [Bacteroidota bacterium]
MKEKNLTNKKLVVSSLSRKYIMAAAGLFLMLFLVMHLATNLLLIIGDEGKTFDKAVDFLTKNPIIKIMEYVLFAGFIIHIIIGLMLELYNYKARPVKYKAPMRSEVSPFSKYMIHSGIIIFIFLVLHLFHFFFIKLGYVDLPETAEHGKDFFNMAIVTFGNPLYSGIYLISFLFLGFHLKHAFQSAFQTYGLYHNRYNKFIKIIATIYALAIAIGFSIIPVYFLFFYNA